MAEQEPVLTEAFLTAQSEGKAFTLKYKNRFLYSKYNPQKNILQAVQSLELLPGTLVLVFSPALFYGFEELEQKCKASSSAVLCVEADKGLHDYEKKVIKEKALAAVLLPFEENTAQGLDDFFSKSKQKFRRVARLDFSAGVSFYEDFYRAFYECAQNIVAAFWKNRLTLVRLGRLFCKNLFKNLLPAARSIPFDALEKTVEKPILVCGAGESLDQLTALPCGNSFINDKFFVLAVDAALPALGGAGIKIDAAASTESQWAIEKVYIGLKDAVTKNKERPIFFFDLSSRAQIARRFSKSASFYFSEFDKNKFLSRLQKEGLLPASAPPLGSIGLTAVYLALRLRKSADVPVCVLGLDFSFSAGQTHARGTAQSKALLAQSNRLRPAQNCAAAFAPGTEKILGKDGRACWTSKNLFGYAALFKQYFNGAPALYDLGESGIDLGLEKKRLSDFFTERAASNDSGLAKAAGFSAAERVQKVRQFLRKELEDLRALADLLSNGEAAKSRDKSIALDRQIMAALDGREYLYLHFPDGTEAKPERSFLTRVRAQIDFFAKDIESALAIAAR
ncbi:MAG: DUF115 domain-containing protein [Treponema sp.]|nr:DUF115 domain-containing protein [Treponema sp.]